MYIYISDLPPIVNLEGGRNFQIQTAAAPPFSDPTPKQTNIPAYDVQHGCPATKWYRLGRLPGRVPSDPYCVKTLSRQKISFR